MTHAHHMLDKTLLIIAFPLQQWLQERTAMSLYTYTACLVNLLAPEFYIQILAHPVCKM
jgi:hypothetical protein